MADDLLAEARRARRALAAAAKVDRPLLIARMYAELGMSLADLAAFWGLARPTVHGLIRQHEQATGARVLRDPGYHHPKEN